MLNFFFQKLSKIHYLSPDKSTEVYNIYHKSSKYLVPMMSLSGFNHSFVNQNHFTNLIDTITVSNIYFHSLVSCSTIITDYITNIKLNTICRIINIKGHSIALLGFIYFINCSNENNNIIKNNRNNNR